MVNYEDLKRCAYRELLMREKVYGRWVNDGKMRADTADKEIRLMKQIVYVLSTLASGHPAPPGEAPEPEKQPDLFG